MIGIDEVGRGAAAGELTIAAVRAETAWRIPGLKDSKELSRKQRETLSQALHQEQIKGNIEFIIISSSNQEIDQNGLAYELKANYIKSINDLYQPNEEIILDGNLNPMHLSLLPYPKLMNTPKITSMIKADTIIPHVEAASIIAKHYRDQLMINRDSHFPHYNFKKNVGYLSKEHIAAIKEYGFSSLHRLSYHIKGIS